MSELKFRAWHEEIKMMQDFYLTEIATCPVWDGQYRKWISLIGINFCEEGTLIEFLEFGDRRLKIMRYLGKDCLDVEGKEYAVDDIVEDIMTGRKFKIIYEQGRTQKIDLKTWVETDLIYFIDYRIIANVHQNPELIHGN